MAKGAGKVPLVFGNADKYPGSFIYEIIQNQIADKEVIRSFVFGQDGASFVTPENLKAAQMLKAWVDEHRNLYSEGKIGDVVVKRKLVEILNALIDPIRTRRKHFEDRPDDVIDALRLGTAKANLIAEETLALAKKAMRQDYFGRKLAIDKVRP